LSLATSWLVGRGGGRSMGVAVHHTSTPRVHPPAVAAWHAQASLAGSQSWLGSPFETRLLLAFSRGSSGSSTTAVSVWLLSPETLRFLSSRRVGLWGTSTAWSVGSSLTGGLSTKYFSTGRSLSSGASKGSCLFPALHSPVGRGDKNTEMKVQDSHEAGSGEQLGWTTVAKGDL
jgi:hypothetical protein